MEKEGLKILVAFDGSELSLEAVKYVGQLMPVKQTEVVLFHVETQMPEGLWKTDQNMGFRFNGNNIRACITEQHKRINTAMEKAEAMLKKEGFAPDAIVKKIQAKKLGVVNDIARESHQGYHAVVLGRRGESKLKDILLGSVPTRLLNKIQGIPMIIVGRTPCEYRMMVAFDGSREIMRAVKAMSTLIGVSDCKVSICHVFKPQGMFSNEDAANWKENERKRIEPKISQAKHCLVDSGFSFNQLCCEVIEENEDMSTTIVKKANDEKFTTIVIGRRGLNIYQEFVTRRVGEKIFQLAEHLTVWVVG